MNHVSLRGNHRFPLDPERISTVRAVTRAANGMTLDGEGRRVVCEQGSRTEPARIAGFEPATGSMETVVDAWGGLPLNSPNDVVVKGDGTTWFTDPSYGHLQGLRPEPLVGDYIYRYEPASGHLPVVADGFDKPNGLAFSPDEAVTTPGFPDGVKVDDAGRVYASAFSGVQVFNPAGDLIGEIHLPGAVKFTFGGRPATSCSSPPTRPCGPRFSKSPAATAARRRHQHPKGA